MIKFVEYSDSRFWLWIEDNGAPYQEELDWSIIDQMAGARVGGGIMWKYEIIERDLIRPMSLTTHSILAARDLIAYNVRTHGRVVAQFGVFKIDFRKG